jgi:hypothetical protein
MDTKKLILFILDQVGREVGGPDAKISISTRRFAGVKLIVEK